MKKCLTVMAAVFVALLATRAYAQDIQRLAANYLNFNGTETSSNVKAIATGAGGKLVYSKSLFVPASLGPQVLYVTISAVGDNHSGESNYLSCNIDGLVGVGDAGTVCNPTPFFVGIDEAPPGWVTLSHHFAYDVPDYISNGTKVITSSPLAGGDGGGGTSDEHDNDYYYTWCKRVKPGTHTINLRLGNHSGPTSNLSRNNFVFFEKAFIYIDVSPAPPFGACVRGSAIPPPPPPG
jgi:hypothetical protein